MSLRMYIKRLMPMMAWMLLGCMVTMLTMEPSSPRARVAEPLSHEEVVDDASSHLVSERACHPQQQGEDTRIADQLKEQVRVLCWVMTHPKNHLLKAQHVKATWGRRCNKLIFMSSSNDPELGTVDLGVGDGRQALWGKTKAAFRYVYDHHLHDYDWFFKADDDTYAVMENMRYMLSTYDPASAIYLGSRFKKFAKQGYMSGGGGYVLSREAVRRLVERGLANNTNTEGCKMDDTGAEDAELGKCLEAVGVLAGDSRDSQGRGRFMPFTPAAHLHGAVASWYHNYVYYAPDTGLDCCSDTAITFHYVDAKRLYELDYLLYHLRPYGVLPIDPFPAHLPPDLQSVPKETLDQRKNLIVTPGDADQPC